MRADLPCGNCARQQAVGRGGERGLTRARASVCKGLRGLLGVPPTSDIPLECPECTLKRDLPGCVDRMHVKAPGRPPNQLLHDLRRCVRHGPQDIAHCVSVRWCYGTNSTVWFPCLPGARHDPAGQAWSSDGGAVRGACGTPAQRQHRPRLSEGGAAGLLCTAFSLQGLCCKAGALVE